jgi:hypothetical protein
MIGDALDDATAHATMAAVRRASTRSRAICVRYATATSEHPFHGCARACFAKQNRASHRFVVPSGRKEAQRVKKVLAFLTSLK